MPLEETLQRARQLREEGRIRHAGVSNFPAGMLRAALELAPLLANQVEYHPFLAQDALLALRASATSRSPPTRRSPTAGCPTDPDLNEIGEAHGKTRRPGGAALAARPAERDDRAEGVEPRPPAENFEVFDFALTDEDRERIAALPKDVRTDPPGAPDWDA